MERETKTQKALKKQLKRETLIRYQLFQLERMVEKIAKQREELHHIRKKNKKCIKVLRNKLGKE